MSEATQLQVIGILVQISTFFGMLFVAGKYVGKMGEMVNTIVVNQKVIGKDLKDHIERDDERHDELIKTMSTTKDQIVEDVNTVKVTIAGMSARIPGTK